MRLAPWTVAVLSVPLGGCISHNGDIFDKNVYATEAVHAADMAVEIVDERKNVVPARKFDTPFFSLPGDGASAEVAFSPSVRGDLEKVLARLRYDGQRHLLARLHLVSGVAGWRATWWSEIEYAKIRITVDVEDADTHATLARGVVDGTGEWGSLDATDGGPAALFDHALVAAFERAVATAKAVHDVNAGLVRHHEVARVAP